MSEYNLKITNDQAKELPMVDVAFHILKAANKTFFYRELMDEVAKAKGIAGDEILDKIAQLYTEINIDGRFACVGRNEWGLKRWYPVDKGDDALGGSGRPRIINDEDDDLDSDIDDEIFEDDYSDESFPGFNGDDEPVDATEDVIEDTLVEDIEEGVIVDMDDADDEFDDEGEEEDLLEDAGDDEEEEA